MNRDDSDAPKHWLRWASALVVIAVLLFLGSRLFSWLVEREVNAAIEDVRAGMKKRPPQTHVALRGSKVVWRGDSVGAVLAIVRSPASSDSDTLVLVGTIDSAMVGVNGLFGFVSRPISETQEVLIDLRATTDTVGLHGVATFWASRFPRPIRIFEVAPGTQEREPGLRGDSLATRVRGG